MQLVLTLGVHPLQLLSFSLALDNFFLKKFSPTQTVAFACFWGRQFSLLAACHFLLQLLLGLKKLLFYSHIKCICECMQIAYKVTEKVPVSSSCFSFIWTHLYAFSTVRFKSFILLILAVILTAGDKKDIVNATNKVVQSSPSLILIVPASHDGKSPY